MTDGLLPSGAFRLPDAARRQVDWHRLLSGRPLAAAEIAASAAVPRRLLAGREAVELRDMPGWLATRRGRTVLLEGDAGEGKSTYLHLLADALQDEAVVLVWDAATGHNLDEALSFAGVARSLRLEATAPLVVMAELPPVLDERTGAAVRSLLEEHEARGDEAVVVLAGRAGVLRRATRGFRFETVSLAPMALDEARRMSALLGEAYAAVSDGSTGADIDDQFPHLRHFLALPENERKDYFTRPGQPLIVSLLKAVYGWNFVERLVAEFSRLAPHDRLAYLAVCVATACGRGLPEATARRLVPDADLDARSSYDPWVRTAQDEHVARHAVIAKTVVEATEALAELSTCFDRWTDESRSSPQALDLFFSIILGVTHWEPVTGGNRGRVRRIQRRLGTSLLEEEALARRIINSAGDSAPRFLSWARTLRHLSRPQADDERLQLLDWTSTILAAAREIAGDRDLAERLQYEAASVTRERARALKVPETLEEVESLTFEWADFIGRGWTDSRFYVELFEAAESLATRLTHQQVPDRDSDHLFRVYVIAGRAFGYLHDKNAELAQKYNETAGNLMNRSLYDALPRRHIDVLHEVWSDIRTFTRLAGPGLSLGHALIDAARRRPEEADALLDEAEAVFEAVLDKVDDKNADALLRLAELTVQRKGAAEEPAGPRIQQALENETRPFRLGALHLAAALLESTPTVAHDHLLKASAAYAVADWDGAAWEHHGERWGDVCSRLRKAGILPARDANVYNTKRNRYRRVNV